jgi:non-specific serine/threonine protein kinase
VEKLEQSGEASALRTRHRDWYLQLVEAAESKFTGAEQAVWLGRLEREHDNLRAARRWAVESEPEAELRMVGALWRFWSMHGHLSEGRGWLE